MPVTILKVSQFYHFMLHWKELFQPFTKSDITSCKHCDSTLSLQFHNVTNGQNNCIPRVCFYAERITVKSLAILGVAHRLSLKMNITIAPLNIFSKLLVFFCHNKGICYFKCYCDFWMYDISTLAFVDSMLNNLTNMQLK